MGCQVFFLIFQFDFCSVRQILHKDYFDFITHSDRHEFIIKATMELLLPKIRFLQVNVNASYLIVDAT